MNNKKKGLILSIIGILGLIVITVGVTYAFFNYVKEGTTENSITSGTITFLYTEVSEVGRGISIQDAYPMSDEIGKVQIGEGKVFDFKITSNTSNSTTIPYEVTARKKSSSTLDENVVKLYLTEVDGSIEEEILLDNYSNLVQTTRVDSSRYIEKTIYEGKVPANSINYEKNFRLRMWIDESTDFGPIKGENGEDIYPYNGKEFTITINVYSNGKVVTEEEKVLEENVNIKSISVDNQVLEKLEGKDYDYEITLPEETTSAVVDIETEDPYANVKIEKIDSLAYHEGNHIQRLSTKKTVQLNPGNNYFKVTVTSENKKNSKEYKVCIKLVTTLTQAIFDKYTVIEKSPTLTTTSEIAGENGLYSSIDTNSGKPTYYFRGNVENYVDFAGFTWRVVRINEDGTIRLMMQEGINNNYKGKFNNTVNTITSTDELKVLMYYSNNSNARMQLNNWYTTNIINKGYSSYVVMGNYFCEQAKVAYRSNVIQDSGASMIVYSSYVPNFKCSRDQNGKGIVNSNVGLITYDEMVFAGNYFFNTTSTDNNFWTMSPAGAYFDKASSMHNNVHIWDFSMSELHRGTYRESRVFRPVINLQSDITVIGEGTTSSPWVIQ